MTRSPHLLRQLAFPARYEALVALLGTDVTRLLVAPEEQTLSSYQGAALAVINRGEGLFAPSVALSGAGKTTLIQNLTHFLPSDFAPTVLHTGNVREEALVTTSETALVDMAADDRRVLPILIDHREGDPPTQQELAQIKRFLRIPGSGSRALLAWPDTDITVAGMMADSYRSIAGEPPIALPIDVLGPARDAWTDIATITLQLANRLTSLADLGVDPRNYRPSEYRTLGEFLRKISDDFSASVHKLIASTQIPVGLAVVFVSESADSGVLTQLTSADRFGLVEGQALIQATSGSEIGKWWAERRGLLTQTIVRLDARAFPLPPPAAVPILRRYGPPEVQQMLKTVGLNIRSAGDISAALGRTDLGKYLLGVSAPVFEARGKPSTTTTAGYELLAEEGVFQGGGDKALNHGVGEALGVFLAAEGVPIEEVVTETKSLGFAQLVPDNSIRYDGMVRAIEYTWRSGDFLTTGNRSTVAQYILHKLRNYARELGWVPPGG